MADRPWFLGPDSYLSQMNPARAMPGLSEIISGAASVATGGTYQQGVERLQQENDAFRSDAPAAASMRDVAGFLALGGRNARPIAYPALPAPTVAAGTAPSGAMGTAPSGAMGTALVPQGAGGALVPFNRLATGGTAAATAATPFVLDAVFPKSAEPPKNDGWTPPDQIANLPTSADLKALMIRPVGQRAAELMSRSESAPAPAPGTTATREGERPQTITVWRGNQPTYYDLGTRAAPGRQEITSYMPRMTNAEAMLRAELDYKRAQAEALRRAPATRLPDAAALAATVWLQDINKQIEDFQRAGNTAKVAELVNARRQGLYNISLRQPMGSTMSFPEN